MSELAPHVRSEVEIREWIVVKLSGPMRVPPAEIDLDGPLVAHGLDSVQFVVLVGELEQWLGCHFTDNPLIDYPSINALSKFLADQVERGKVRIDPLEDTRAGD